MRAIRAFALCLGLLLAALLVMGGAGLLTHREALVVTVRKEPAPPGTGEPVQLVVSIRNRTAALVPVSGMGRSPAWELQRRDDAGGWHSLTTDLERQTAWLEPYHQEEHAVPVEEPGVVRVEVRSGLHGELAHASDELPIDRLDFDARPYTH